MNVFRSLGCEVALPYGAPLAEIRALFDERDARFSRVQPSSELNAVNARPLGVAVVSEDFASMLSLGLDAADATDGLVSPAVGGAADSSFDSHRAVSIRGVALLRAEPVVLDLTCVVKARTVDDALDLLGGTGWVSAGGDLAASEPVVVGLPGGGSITVHSGGLATSSVAKPSWLAGRERQHRPIDPRTGAPSTSPWRDVTVAAGTCLAATVAAQAALLLGEQGPAWLERHGLWGRFVSHDGEVHVADWPRSSRTRLPA